MLTWVTKEYGRRRASVNTASTHAKLQNNVGKSENNVLLTCSFFILSTSFFSLFSSAPRSRNSSSCAAKPSLTNFSSALVTICNKIL